MTCDEKESLLVSVWPLIKRAAESSPFTMVPLDDRIQLGALRVWQTLDRFDSTRGKLAGWIRYAVRDAIRCNFYSYRTCHIPKRPYVDVFEVASLEDVENRLELEARLRVLDDVSRQWLVKNLRGEISALRSDGMTDGKRSTVIKRRARTIAKIQELV